MSNPTWRVIVHAANGDVFADLTADIADIQHYRRSGARVQVVDKEWSDDTVRDFARYYRETNRLNK